VSPAFRAVLEAGSRKFSGESQDFHRGTTVGDHYFDLDIARLRFMGGSSNHWAGWCRVLDSQDFEPKAWAPDTGWPISRADIEPYLREVHDILELPDFRPDVPISDDIGRAQLIKSPAVRFGEKFADEIDRSKNIAVVLNTCATELAGDGRRVSGAKLRSNGQDAPPFERWFDHRSSLEFSSPQVRAACASPTGSAMAPMTRRMRRPRGTTIWAAPAWAPMS